MPEDLKQAVAAVLQALSKATDDERLAAFREILSKYCRHCGSDVGPGCQCWNDE